MASSQKLALDPLAHQMTVSATAKRNMGLRVLCLPDTQMAHAKNERIGVMFFVGLAYFGWHVIDVLADFALPLILGAAPNGSAAMRGATTSLGELEPDTEPWIL